MTDQVAYMHLARDEQNNRIANDPRFSEALLALIESEFLVYAGDGDERVFVTDLGVRAASILVGIIGGNIESPDELEQRRLNEAIAEVVAVLADIRIKLVDEGR